MSRYTMGTFVIFKLSPPLNDHLLLDNGNQSRLKMGGVHLALMKWMFSDAAWDTAGNGPVLYFSKLPLSLCLIFCRIIGLLDSRSPFSDSPEINRSTQPSIHFPGVPPKVSELNQQQWQDWSIAPPEIAFLSLMVQILSVMGWISHLARAWTCPLLPYYPYPPPPSPKPITVPICQGQQTNLRLQIMKF